MKDLRCIFGFHDWTAWRRAPMSKTAYLNLPEDFAMVQGRRCKRCGRQESRPAPQPKYRKPPAVE